MFPARFTPLLAAALLLGGCGAATSSTAPAPSGAGVVTPAPTLDGTPPASQPSSADPGAATAPNGATIGDLAGTWTGDVFETLGNAPLSWTSTLTLTDCSAGQSCGDFDQTIPHPTTTGQAIRCHYSLAFPAYREDLGVFTVQEALVAPDSDDNCATVAVLALSPMPGGMTLALEEGFESTWVTYGVLRKQPG